MKYAIDKSYDFIIGEVIGTTLRTEACDQYNSAYRYEVRVDFSFRQRVDHTIQVFGSDPFGGSCGARFDIGKQYLISIRECNGLYYTFRCDPHQWLPFAKYEIDFLNERFHKNYKPGIAWPIVKICALNSFPGFIAHALSWYAFTHKRMNGNKLKRPRTIFFIIERLTILFVIYALLLMLWTIDFIDLAS